MTDENTAPSATHSASAEDPSGASLGLWGRILRRLALASGYSLARRALRQPTALEAPTDALFSPRDVVFEVPIDRCRFLYGGAYGPLAGSSAATSGWHPFVALAHELAARPDLRYEDSVLARFYQRFQPRNQVEFFFPQAVADEHRDSALARLPLDAARLPVLPWYSAVWTGKGEHGLGPEHGHQSFGPVTVEKGRLEFRRVRSTFLSIREHGYRPELASGEIIGNFILKGDDYRFLVRGGHHRLAAMAALGWNNVRVAFYKQTARSVNIEAAGLWPLVRAGIYDEGLARLFVEQLFADDHSWRARELGLLDDEKQASTR